MSKRPSDPPIPVLFRVFQKEVIALFPTVPSDVAGRYVQSYAHVGQHGGADLGGVMADSRPAKPVEYAPLKRELEQIGYKFDVYQRTAPWMRKALRDALRA